MILALITMFKRYSEPAIWSLALITLWAINPAENPATTLCIFHNIGITWCPGCGIGRSISHFLHGDILASFQTHPLGIPAVLILLFRILQILIPDFRKIHFYTKTPQKYGENTHA